MELRAVRAFVAVADAGSVTAAAHGLHLTQPAVSRLVQGLERELGLALFDRVGNRLVLTGAGAQLLDAARDLTVRAARTRELAEALRRGRLAEVTVSAPPTTLRDVIAPFLATWGPDDPTPHVVEAVGATPYDGLRRGVDLAVGAEAPPTDSASALVAVLPVWGYLPAGHRLAASPALDVGSVDEPLVVLGPTSHARRSVDAALRSAGAALGEHVEVEQPEVAQALAAAGRGIAVVSDDPRFGLVGVPLTCGGRPVVVRLSAAWDPAHHAAAALAGLAERLAAFCAARYPG